MPRPARSRARIETLITESATPLAVAEIAKLLGLSVSGVQKTIDALMAEGVVVADDGYSPTGGYLYRAKNRRRGASKPTPDIAGVPQVGDLYRVMEVNLVVRKGRDDAVEVVLWNGGSSLRATLALK